MRYASEDALWIFPCEQGPSFNETPSSVEGSPFVMIPIRPNKSISAFGDGCSSSCNCVCGLRHLNSCLFGSVCSPLYYMRMMRPKQLDRLPGNCSLVTFRPWATAVSIHRFNALWVGGCSMCSEPFALLTHSMGHRVDPASDWVNG